MLEAWSSFFNMRDWALINIKTICRTVEKYTFTMWNCSWMFKDSADVGFLSSHMKVAPLMYSWVVTYRLQQCLSVFFINFSVLSADNKVVFYFIGIGSVSLQFFVACIKDIQEKELVPKWQFVCAQIVWSHQIRFSILPTNNAVFHVYRNVLQEPLFQWCALHGLGYMEIKGGPLQLLLPRKSEQCSYPSLCWSFWKINWRELWMRMDFCYMGRHLMLAKGGLLSILL